MNQRWHKHQDKKRRKLLFVWMIFLVCFYLFSWLIFFSFFPHYVITRARWQWIKALCQNRSVPKVWTRQWGSQCLVLIKPHSCLPPPLPPPPPFCTQSNRCHSVPQNNKGWPLFQRDTIVSSSSDSSSLAQNRFCFVKTTEFFCVSTNNGRIWLPFCFLSAVFTHTNTHTHPKNNIVIRTFT